MSGFNGLMRFDAHWLAARGEAGGAEVRWFVFSGGSCFTFCQVVVDGSTALFLTVLPIGES
jgi:hypothetical protein